MNYLYEIAMLAMIVAVCKIQAGIFAKNTSIGTWFHVLWACPFAGYVIVLFFITHHNYWLSAALALEHFAFFNPILNYIRQKPFFYLGVKTKTEAWTDIVLEAIDNAYPIIWVAIVLLFIVTQFYI